MINKNITTPNIYKSIFNKSAFYLCFVVFYALSQGLLFYFLPLSFTPYYLLDIILVLGILSFGFLFRKNIFIYVASLLLYTLIILFDLFNINLYEIFGDLLTFNKFPLVTDAITVFDISFLNFRAIAIYLGILICFIIVNSIMLKKFKNPAELQPISRILPFFACFIIGTTIPLPVLEYGENVVTIDNHEYDGLYYNSFYKYEAIKRKAFFGFYYNEMKSILPQFELSEEKLNESRNFLTSEVNKPNNFTGSLENYNVITILLETGQPFTIHEDLTPNLYKITGYNNKNDFNETSIKFPLSFSENKTNFSENIAIIGSAPTYGTQSLLNAPGNVNLPFALANVLSSKGYKTSYAHDNSSNFYKRKTYIPNFGYDNLYFHKDIFTKDETKYIWDKDKYDFKGNYALDTQTINNLIKIDKSEENGKIFSKDSPFYFHFSSMVTHGPYDEKYNDINNFNIFKERGYFDRIDASNWVNPLEGKNKANGYKFNLDNEVKYYQAAMMNFDEALGLLLNHLEEKNLLDNTLLVVFGDHNNYYNNICFNRFNDDGSKNFDDVRMYDTILSIYNPNLTKKYLENNNENNVYNKFVSPYVITPTILDLLGIEYYTNMYVGDSIFSENYADLMYSHKIYSIFNETYITSNGKDIKILNEDLHTEDRLNNFKNDLHKIMKKYYFINEIYNLNLL